MIEKLEGREKLQQKVIADKVNELIDVLNALEPKEEKENI